MNTARVLVARATSRAAWTRRLMSASRAVDRFLAWRLERDRRAEAAEVRRRRQRRQRKRQRAATRRAWVANWRHRARVASHLEALDPRKGNR